MNVQDDSYRDNRFSIAVPVGQQQGIVVCEAAARRHLVRKDLPPDHFTYYSDSSIPERLSSVMACPVICDNGQLRGVVALDSKTRFDDLGLDIDSLEELFLKLCETVAHIVQGKGAAL